MPAEIYDNQFAYAGEAAWHGLGQNVPRGTTGKEMLKIAGLDWPVELRPIQVADSIGDNPNFIGEPGFVAITRADNNRVFNVGRPGYQIVQNEEIVDFFREFCEAGHATMETVGALRGGAVIWAQAKLSKDTDKSIGGVDAVVGHMLLATSHDKTMVTTGRPTQTRVVCANTLRAAMAEDRATFRLHHSQKFDDTQKQRAREVMGMAIEEVQKINQIAEQLSQVKIGDREWLTFMTKLMGDEEAVMDKAGKLKPTAMKIRNATLTSPGSGLVTAKDTLWGAINGVSYFVDHQRGAKQDSRLNAAWFGEGDKLKSEAVHIAAEMAGILVGA